MLCFQGPCRARVVVVRTVCAAAGWLWPLWSELGYDLRAHWHSFSARPHVTGIAVLSTCALPLSAHSSHTEFCLTSAASHIQVVAYPGAEAAVAAAGGVLAALLNACQLLQQGRTQYQVDPSRLLTLLRQQQQQQQQEKESRAGQAAPPPPQTEPQGQPQSEGQPQSVGQAQPGGSSAQQAEDGVVLPLAMYEYVEGLLRKHARNILGRGSTIPPNTLRAYRWVPVGLHPYICYVDCLLLFCSLLGTKLPRSYRVHACYSAHAALFTTPN